MVQGEDEEVEGKQHQEVLVRFLGGGGTPRRQSKQHLANRSHEVMILRALFVHFLSCKWTMCSSFIVETFCSLILNFPTEHKSPGWCVHGLRAASYHLFVAVVEQHQGGVDDLAVHVGGLALPAPEGRLGVNPLVELVLALVPQHHLLAKKQKIAFSQSTLITSMNSGYFFTLLFNK